MPDDPEFPGYPPNCPLPAATRCQGAVFRITRTDPFTDEDFKSNFELGKEPRPKTTAAQRCKWRSLSIYTTIEDARHHVKLFPDSSGKYIAAATLTPERGLMLPTPSQDGSRQSHCEWWCSHGQDRKSGFVVIE